MNSDFVSHLMMNRRTALKGSLALGLTGAAGLNSLPVAQAKPSGGLDYSDPVDNLYAFGKIWAGFDEPVIGAFHGLMYGRIAGERMVPLFGYTGTGVLLAKFDENDNVWFKSRETGFFTDLESGDILETWYNPFTEKTVEVFHFYNDATIGVIGKEIPKFFLGTEGDSPTLMNEGTVFPDEDGRYPFLLPFQTYGDDVMLSWDYTHKYTNPVTPQGWPRSSTGAQITPSEHFTFNVSKQALQDRDLPTVRFTAGFSRMSEFWPFMEMGGTPYADGAMFGRMFSHKGLNGTDDVPPKVLAYIEKYAPDYLTLPDTWEPSIARIDTWRTYANDIAPENPDYDWQPVKYPVPTGRGAQSRKTPDPGN